jgi:transposase
MVRGRGRGKRALAAQGYGSPAQTRGDPETAGLPLINGKNPLQYGFDFGLWTRAMVRELIIKKFGIRLSITSVDTLLAELNLTPQKPLQRADQHDPEAVQRWQRDTYPALVSRAKREKAEIYFWDESGFFCADAVHGKTWAERGNTPVVSRPGQRQGISAVGRQCQGSVLVCHLSGRSFR